MAATNDIYYGALAASAALDVRPPIGEIWNVTRFDQAVNTSAALRLKTAVSAAGRFWDTEAGVGPLWITNGLWAQAVNTSSSVASGYGMYVVKCADTAVPVRVGFADFPAGGGTLEMRPPVGTDWFMKLAWTSATGARTLAIKNATSTSTGITFMTGTTIAASPGGVVAAVAVQKYGAAASILLTNTTWVALTVPNDGSVLCLYSELPSGALSQRSNIQTVAASGLADIRAPLGEVWMIGAWMCTSTSILTPNDGTTRYSSVTNGWPNLKANVPVGNAKYVTVSAGTTGGTLGWIGWLYPL